MRLYGLRKLQVYLTLRFVSIFHTCLHFHCLSKPGLLINGASNHKKKYCTFTKHIYLKNQDVPQSNSTERQVLCCLAVSFSSVYVSRCCKRNKTNKILNKMISSTYLILQNVN